MYQRTNANSEVKKKQRLRKPVYLNTVKDSDVIEFIAGLRNFSEWVKSCARKEISTNQQQEEKIDTQAIAALVEKLIDIRLNGKVLTDTKVTVEENGDLNIDILGDIDQYL